MHVYGVKAGEAPELSVRLQCANVGFSMAAGQSTKCGKGTCQGTRSEGQVASTPRKGSGATKAV